MNTLSHAQSICTRTAFLFLTTACSILLIWTSANASMSSQVAQDSPNQSGLKPQLYIPLIDNSVSCTLSPEATALIELIQSHPAQARTELQCDPILSRVATQKARDMASKGYFDHTSPTGVGPNHLVRSAQFPLSESYSKSLDANNIESLAGGTSTPQATFDIFLDSSGHRRHLLGENSFYREQRHIGVGMVHNPDSPYRYYWVVFIAKAEVAQ